jgi:ABC-type dipeptide/oligopeptide/nickel transport system permease subunit
MKSFDQIVEEVDLQLLKGFVYDFVKDVLERLLLFLVFIPAAVVFFVSTAVGIQLFGDEPGFQIGGVVGFGLSLLTMFGLAKLIRSYVLT